MASEIAGPRAPAVLVRYAVLTYLNRTSRGRPIRKVPRKAVRTAASPPPQWDADIVVPVYNDFEGISGVLDLLRREAPQFNSIVLVDDCSIDTRIAPLLSVFRDSVPNAVLIENARNLGFLRTCNRGLEASKHDVIILNTDIELPVGALGRLVDVLRAKGDIASVTPFSSNAYGAGFPDLNYDSGRPFGATTAQIDTAFQAIGPFEPIEIPRGVGFCMAMSRTAIERVGVFDTDFGAGYGEEANFCLRAHGEGFRNLLAPNIYVYHKAGQSFGASSQRKAREGLVRLLARHPDYVGLVRTYLEGGEARAVNFAALVRLAEDLSGRSVLQRDAPLLHRAPDGTTASLALNGEVYQFAFASRDIGEKVFGLAGLRG
jgi:GT2 family glycosyltransferase